MDTSFGLVGLGALLLALPVLLHRYLQRLPVAPSCPSCRMVIRQVEPAGWLLHLLPFLAATIVGECTRCGWKGRMRWRWATRSATRRGG